MPYPGNVHKYIMPVLLMSSCFQERLSVLAAPRMMRSTFLDKESYFDTEYKYLSKRKQRKEK